MLSVLVLSQFGTGACRLMQLMVLTIVIVRVASPGSKELVAIVASPSELAATSALWSVVGSIA